MKILTALRREESRLQKQADEIGRKLGSLRKALGALGSNTLGASGNGRRRRTKRRKMSAAARRRISIAQKKRWARWAAKKS
jgi:hypothetical protein